MLLQKRDTPRLLSQMSNSKLVELEIEGMTCTACARRVEKNLNKVPGVTAYVDFATEKAHVTLSQIVDNNQLIAAVESAGYKVGQTKSELKSLRVKILIGSVLSAFTMLLGMTPFPNSAWWLFALATPVVFWVAADFHIAALKNLRHLDTTMDTLVSLGSLVAYGYSVYLLLMGHPHLYFEVAAVVPTVVLIGRYIEVKARRSATDSVRALLSAIPEKTTVLRDNQMLEIQTSEVKPGDEIFVAAGERVPVDAVALSAGSIDNSSLTGESLPVEVSNGSEITAGATSLAGQLRVRATAVSAQSRISRIADLVREATSQKTKLTTLTDRISAVFVPSVIVLSIITFAAWVILTGDVQKGFETAVAVLVIACPCALGIAVPMSLVVATSVGAKLGIVIRNPDSLQTLAKVKRVVFDKTGTLTTGVLKVVKVTGLGGVDSATALRYAAAIERGSNHPVAKAISEADQILSATEIKEVAGSGLEGLVETPQGPLRVFAGKPGEYLNQDEVTRALASAGPNTLVVVAWEGWAHGLIELSDEARREAKQAVALLGQMGMETTLLSGDNPARVQKVAQELGIVNFKGGVSPEEKLTELKSDVVTAMVGDGINDIAALAAADVGIAMGSGAHAAQAAAAITILDDNPADVPFALGLAKRTRANILQNLAWAFGYNLLLIPVAALGLLNPMLAGTAMALSSVSVVVNARRLARFEYRAK